MGGAPHTAAAEERRFAPKAAAVQAMREAMARGDLREAEHAAQALAEGHVKSYETLATLNIATALSGCAEGGGAEEACGRKVSGYRRELDLEQGIAGVRFGAGGCAPAG